jgi:hypothetical protein
VRIVYVAQHDRPNSNDDEGAIAHALAEAGHTVVRVPETDAGRRVPSTPGDVLLFHKWSGPDTLARVAGRMLRVMWYFDLVKSGAPGLARLSKSRADWMASVLPHLDVGFCTDGDWVEEYNGRCFGGTRGGHRDKLYWLPQGADGRVAGRGEAGPGPRIPILYTGSTTVRTQRQEFLEMMGNRYGADFVWERNAYRRSLADLIARADVVVAPDSPSTDLYWSNRVYITLGFGGFLLHPYCSRLANHHYTGDKELVFYRDWAELRDKIEHYAARPAERAAVAAAGLARTLAQHTYARRVAEMLSALKTQWGVG